MSVSARRRKNWGMVAFCAAIVALGIGWPFAWIEVGTRQAVACLATYRAPREGAVRRCSDAIPWFVTPSRIPWTRTPASYRAEEISGRIAVEDYLDAAIGHPDKAALGRAGEGLTRADRAIRAGSTRIELTELGKAMSAPSIGYYADFVGDRATLVAKADEVLDWKARLHVLGTAFEDATTERVSAITHAYAGMDPRDEDLRVAVGAALCLVGDGKLGVDFLTFVQDGRAIQRHEAMARDFGDVRAAIVACADKFGIATSPRPENPEAGQLDEPEVRATLRLRTLAARTDAKPVEKRDAALGVIGLLLEGSRPSGARLALTASLLAIGHPLEATEVATLATQKIDEAPLAHRLASPADWLEERVGVVPSPGVATYTRAAERAAELARAPELQPAARATLLDLEAAAWIEVARAHAALGEADDLVAAFERGSRAIPTDAERKIARATGLGVAGATERGLDELLGAEDGAEADVKKRVLVLRAELLASAGKREEAGAAAVAADAIETSDAELDVRTRWARLALAPASRLRAPRPVPRDELFRPLAWPSASLFDKPLADVGAGADAIAPIEQGLSLWASALAAPRADRLAIRYALVERRGASPRARVAYLDAAAALLPKGEGDVEIWLDAFSAVDARAIPMRTAAWARADAARWRGDATAAALWTNRARRLARIAASDPELAAVLGL